MADRYDPKLSVRPLSERRPPAPSDDSDPLVELARIVSGRSTFDPAPQPKAKTVPVNPSANGALSAEPSLANDLESELMNDLQASFAAVAPPAKPAAPPVRQAPPPAPAATRPAPAPAAARPAPAPAPKAPPPTAPTQRPASQPAAGALFVPPKVATPAPRPATSAQPPVPAARQPAPPAADRAARPAAPPPARPAPPPVAAKASPPVSERPARPAAPPPRAERPVTQPPVRPADRGDFATAPLRPTTQVHADPPAAPAPAGRWGRAEEDAGEDEASRFAPPRARNWFRANRGERAEPPRPAARAPISAPEPEITEADHDMFEDAAPTLAEADQLYQDDLALEDIAHYGDDDADLPPLVDELPDMGHRRTSRGLLAVMALLVVALAGGAGYYVLKGRVGGTDSPPLIAADPSPTKVVPPDDGSQQTADAQNKLIYDRVDPVAKTTEDTTTNLVTPGSEKIADVNKPTEAGDDGNPVSRVIMQGGPVEGDGAPAKVADGAAPAAASPSGDTDSLGPKKVRTVVVRPDGTIVSSEAAPADGSGAPPAAAAADPNKPPSEVAGGLDMAAHGSTTMDTVLEKGGNIPVNADPLASDGQPPPAPAGTVPAGDAAAARAAAPPAPTPTAAASADTGDTAAGAAPDDGTADAAPAAAPAPAPKPAAKPKPVVVAKGEPIDLTPSSKPSAAPAAAPADSAAVTGGLSVQVTSQKSEAAAMSAFRSMQSRYAQVLGRYQPNVQRADLGDRGTYYRVRVGPFAGDGASRVCAALKAAGGDCIIVK